MDEFEKQIKGSLAREDPSPWLESRILAAVAQAENHVPRRSIWQTHLRWAMTLGAVVVLITGVAWQRERVLRERVAREQAEGETAKLRLLLALKITSLKLQQIQQEVLIRNTKLEVTN